MPLVSAEEARSAIDVAALVESYSLLLFRVAYSVLRSRTEAEDTVQDVFVRVLKHRGSLPAVRDMRVWLVRIAWNLAVDSRRRARAVSMEPEFTEQLAAKSVPADAALGEAERLQRVLAEIERLPGRERKALLLSAVDEMSVAEVAQVMGRSESAVRALVFRARSRLRERLGEEGAR